jgi:hypothetical protein
VKLIIKSIILLLLLSTPCFPFTEQATTERIIKENRSFIDFLNICITNFGDQGKIDIFKKIYEMHFNGFVAYLQSDYKRAFNRIYESQYEQEKLCSDMVKNLFLEDAKDILDELAPLVIRSKSSKARLYLTLGYRERTVGRNNYVIGMASNPKLHSYKLYEFIKAIKRARRAKRYGFLALFESQSNEMKLKIYSSLLEKENNEGNPFYTRFLRKSGGSFMDEVNKPYEDYKENLKNNESVKNIDASGKAAADETAVIKASVETYESQIQKRVRFRNEAKLAKLLMFSEFDRASDFMRDYVDDLHYKLITATFDVLSVENKGTEKKIDYNTFKIHHTDNYSRYFNKSAIDNFVDTLKVQDDLNNEMTDSEKKDGTGEAKMMDKTENVIDKKEMMDRQDKIIQEKKEDPKVK